MESRIGGGEKQTLRRDRKINQLNRGQGRISWQVAAINKWYQQSTRCSISRNRNQLKPKLNSKVDLDNRYTNRNKSALRSNRKGY